MNFSASNQTSAAKRYEEHDSPSGVRGIRRSFSYARRESFQPVGPADRRISYGDRLFARLVMHGRTVLEFMADSINDLTELWGELRRKCRGLSGLAKLYLRNASRGWSMEKPLMLYPENRRGLISEMNAVVRTSSFSTPTVDTGDSIARAFRGEARQLAFTWT